MKINSFPSILLGLFICTLAVLSCSNGHLITDKAERDSVYSDFEKRKSDLAQPELFKIFKQPMSKEQQEAMTFLYAYMPLTDLAYHSGEYFLENVDYALKARKEMPWGEDIPEREFRHFVLPLRVNNENLDDCRKIFYNELKERVQHLSLYDAVLEVNHWCHEKVIYTPSDARTSSPLASIKTAYGRCGEESVFTVAALRSVGIPARQVYTPRWAHTDDNHAWVEAWVDGKWYFLGACEPEPVLDLAWFNAPASRGMLMHTKVFGNYNGPEEVMLRTPRYTEINVIDNYAPTATATVNVVDASGLPLQDATVEFKVYNYAEFYTVANKLSGKDGKTSLTAGCGDMLVWASKDGKFGYSKLSFDKDAEITISVDKTAGEAYSLEWDIVPPAEGANMPEVTEEQRTENNRRLAVEDSIRNAYVATFVKPEEASAFARECGLDEATVTKLLVASRGNHAVIKEFLRWVTAPGAGVDAQTENGQTKAVALDLLQQISAKDLRDISLEVLQDNMHAYKLSGSQNNADNTFKDVVTSRHFAQYILNPRVSNEMLVPYKEFFANAVPDSDKEAFVDNPMNLVNWVAQNIRVDGSCNLGGAPINPIAVWNARMADAHSRNIFFVALARSMGIAARIDEVTGKVQLIEAGKGVKLADSRNLDNNQEFIDVDFEAVEQTSSPKGLLKARYNAIKTLDDPKYYTHFTLAKITEKGTLQLLNYEEGDVDMGGGASWSNLLKNGTELDTGNYVMLTGTRMANGSVLARQSFFTINEGKTTIIDLVMRESLTDVQVIGSFNSESLYTPATTTSQNVPAPAPVSVLSTTGRGYFVVAVLGVNQEPTNHALRDIAALGKEFEKWGRSMLLLFPSKEDFAKFNQAEFPGLPSTITYGIDTDNANNSTGGNAGGAIQKQIIANMKLGNNNLPIFIIADTFNRVVFVSQGYTIGLGEQLMNVIHKL